MVQIFLFMCAIINEQSKMNAQTIEEVVAQMENIMSQASSQKSPLGYFAGMYRLVTLTVAKGAEANEFEDNERMIRLVISFANRYLKAYDAYQNGENLSLAWWDAFMAAETKGLLILQHLFLGMNAHIHLDLGFSAAEVCRDCGIDSLEKDFLKINVVLFNLINEVQDRLAAVSPVMHWIDFLGGDRDEKLAGFSLVKARDAAWKIARTAAKMPEEERESYERLVDKRTSRIARIIVRPGMRLRLLVRLVNLFESRDQQKIIDALWAKENFTLT